MLREIKDTISVRVRNNTSLPQNVNLLGGTSDPLGVPPSLLYQWDLSTETYFGSVTATIVISNTSNTTPVTYTVQVNGYNIQAVVSALNTLNMGVFQSSGDIIYVSNDFYIYGLLQVGSTAFVSTWNTSNTSFGSSASNQIHLPLESSGTYNFTVDWGDGSQDTITTWNQAQTTHTYATAGTYTLSIVGVIEGFRFAQSNQDRNKILSISTFGNLKLGNNNGYFTGCGNLVLSSVSDVLDLSGTTNLLNMFSGCNSLTTIANVGSWDVSNVTNMSYMFSGTNLFNDDLSNWDTSSV
jgi:surface protein